MKVSQTATDIIKKFEGLRLNAYQDSGGLWTIGYGSRGPDIIKGTTWTQEQSDARLSLDLQILAEQITDRLKVPLNDNEFSALMSFAYNLGIAALFRSTLFKYVNAGELELASDEFEKWVHDDGKVIQGLLNRRRAEKELFLTE